MSFIEKLRKLLSPSERKESASDVPAAADARVRAVTEPGDHKITSPKNPWEDRSRTPENRLQAYSTHISRELKKHHAALDTLPADEANALRNSDDYQWLLQESQAIREGQLTPTAFCFRMDTLSQVILDSFYMDRKGFAHLTIPAGVSDLEAIDALCGYFKKKKPDVGHRGLNESQIDWYVTHGGTGARDVSKPREISFIPVVGGTKEVFRQEQERVLKSRGLTWVPEIELALVGLAYSCLKETTGSVGGGDLLVPDIFDSKSVRGASLNHGVAMSNTGVLLEPMPNYTPPPFWVAAGKEA